MSDALYEQIKARANERNLAASKQSRDIGELPPVADPERKARAVDDFRYFLENYFPALFTLKWSADHLRVISKVETCVKSGGLFAVGMPRGSGKTTICECAVIWAILTGRHRFAYLICADATKAAKAVDNIKLALELNDLLAADFPEACYPIRKLENITRRAQGQLYQGEPTRIEWNANGVRLATIPGAACSGAVIAVGGITAAVRGASYQTPDGERIRPSLVMVDDPQTRESAASPSQCKTREQIIAADLLGMAGPGQSISVLMPCTVIRKGDMADRLLNRKLHPEWHGERCKLVYKWPDRLDLWEEYGELRRQAQQEEREPTEADAFYAERREEMDAGAEMAWPERKLETELSAIQHAYNLYIVDAEAFASEYQNEPVDETDDATRLTAEEIEQKTNAYPRGVVPADAHRVTAFIDVQQKLLYYVVVAWADRFTGYVIDYGTWPDQKRRYFTLADAKRSLAQAFPGLGREGSIYQGLGRLCDELLTRTWRRDDGTDVRIDRTLIDSKWGASTDVVYKFCRESAYPVLPSNGVYVGASSPPLTDRKGRKTGDKVGLNWIISGARESRRVKLVRYDTNFWKSFVHARVATPIGEPGALSLWGGGTRGRPPNHRMFADQLCAEYSVPTEGRGRKVDEWKVRPNQDNHLFDCLVGATVAASLEGVKLMERARVKKTRKRAVGYL